MPSDVDNPASSLDPKGSPDLPGSRRKTGRKKPDSVREALCSMPLPDWLPREIWQSFVDYRSQGKDPLTLHGGTIAIKKLEKLRAEGNDPVDVIETSILSGWKGLFSVKGKDRRGHSRPFQPSLMETDTTAGEGEGTRSAVKRL